jgi:malonyl-CoA/methylmalonyl-CoA synthetase
MLKDVWDWSEREVLLHSLPIFHVHCLFVACHCVLAAGAAMIFLTRFDLSDVLQQLPCATVMMGVPTYYTRLLAAPYFGVKHCKNIRLFISGSAPLLAQTHVDFEQRTGQKILERYGMSETNMLTSNPLKGERRAGTVGPALPKVQVRVASMDQQCVASNEVGSIEVKGENVFKGYWRMSDKTS